MNLGMEKFIGFTMTPVLPNDEEWCTIFYADIAVW